VRLTIGRKRRRNKGNYRGGPGRPRGVKNGQGVTPTLLEPKPIHDYVLLLHLAGRTNKEVAEVLGITPQTVTNVLRSEWAQEKIVHLRGTVQSGLLGQIDSQLLELATKSIGNIRTTVNANISPLHPMKRHQDKVGLQLLEGVGFLKGAKGDKENEGGGRVTFGEEASTRIAKALERAARVQERGLSSDSDREIMVVEGGGAS